MENKKTERILGIDPGFGRTGWGVIEKVGREWRAVAWGCVETSAKEPFANRLFGLHKELRAVVKKYKPACAAVEDLFFAKNVKTAMKVGQARGVILLTLKQLNLPIFEFTPLQVKQAMTGYGRAEKGQMQKMMVMLLRVKKKIASDDAADALAVALTCAFALPYQKRGGIIVLA
ncbi:MAG: crossover junction endodeoxyribonuclease RuvC [Candidatus Magasanikbacteria bacterium]|nr:crossover junction endodeoxyribonuclease RuvC [Candidatus Magasanikbacteria bacterium]